GCPATERLVGSSRSAAPTYLSRTGRPESQHRTALRFRDGAGPADPGGRPDPAHVIPAARCAVAVTGGLPPLTGEGLIREGRVGRGNCRRNGRAGPGLGSG